MQIDSSIYLPPSFFQGGASKLGVVRQVDGTGQGWHCHLLYFPCPLTTFLSLPGHCPMADTGSHQGPHSSLLRSLTASGLCLKASWVGNGDWACWAPSSQPLGPWPLWTTPQSRSTHPFAGHLDLFLPWPGPPASEAHGHGDTSERLLGSRTAQSSPKHSLAPQIRRGKRAFLGKACRERLWEGEQELTLWDGSQGRTTWG